MLLDSGPLVLFIYGSLRPDLVGTGKTKNHTRGMFAQLNGAVSEASTHISLPNVLTEASNHLGSGKQQQVPNSAQALSAYILKLREVYQPSKDVIQIGEYLNVGLADAAIISCIPQFKREGVRVFTQDWELYGRLSKQGVDCINIMHWATPKRSRSGGR